MEILVLLALLAAVGAGLGVGWVLAVRAAGGASHRSSPDGGRGGPGATADEVAAAVERALDGVRAERAETLQAAVDTVLSVASSKLGDALTVASSQLGEQLSAGKMVIDRERDAVTHQVEAVGSELQRVGALVAALQADSAEQQGRLETGLRHAYQVTSTLASTTQSLERALASPKARGQWGERMAEDVLRVAGFTEGVNYRKQTKAEGGGIPDYTFLLPHGHVVHMDVKFPIDNYRRWLDAESDADRALFAKQFQRDVRQRIRELADRAYIDPHTTVDYLLLFVPNESVYGFLHEHDEEVIDVALAQKVVLCSPTTLFAVLAVIRQSVDNFLVERRSDEILGALGGLREQWEKWKEPMDKMGRALETARKAHDDLAGTRTRAFERQLEKLETVRDHRESDDDDLAERPGELHGRRDDDRVAAADPVDSDASAAQTPPPPGLEAIPAVRPETSTGQLSLRSVG
ncbi:MAG: DNA recombination protein RmuC [Actinomycetota bacterium]